MPPAAAAAAGARRCGGRRQDRGPGRHRVPAVPLRRCAPVPHVGARSGGEGLSGTHLPLHTACSRPPLLFAQIRRRRGAVHDRPRQPAARARRVSGAARRGPAAAAAGVPRRRCGAAPVARFASCFKKYPIWRKDCKRRHALLAAGAGRLCVVGRTRAGPAARQPTAAVSASAAACTHAGVHCVHWIARLPTAVHLQLQPERAGGLLGVGGIERGRPVGDAAAPPR